MKRNIFAHKTISILSIFLFSILLSLTVFAKEDLTISLDQKEFYFPVGEDGFITLHTDNSYKENISGTLSYTVTQEIKQGNFQYSNTNTKSIPLIIPTENNDIQLGFGTSNQPLTLTVDLTYSYSQKDVREVNLNGILIHFIPDTNQSQNQNNQQQNQQNQQKQQQVSSSSEKAQSTSQQNNQANNQQQQMQDMINKMLGQDQQQNTQQTQTTKQKIQNNQMNQDSSALKAEMQKQAQEQQQLQQAFQQELAKNKEFQQAHVDELQKGFNVSGGNLNPSTNNTGDFELNYQDKNGNTATLKGSMLNGTMTSLEKDTPETRDEILNKLRENVDFKKYDSKLQKKGYQENDVQFSLEDGYTQVSVQYNNEQNKTATITADYINESIKNVQLIEEPEQNETTQHALIKWIIILFILGIIGFFIYKKFPRKNITIENKAEISITKEPFDYKAESLKLLHEAEKKFAKEEYKDAYSKANQALRLYLNYHYSLWHESTNDDLIAYLQQNKKPYKAIKECFDLCSLVEFAKSNANKTDFNKIISFAKNKITK